MPKFPSIRARRWKGNGEEEEKEQNLDTEPLPLGNNDGLDIKISGAPWKAKYITRKNTSTRWKKMRNSFASIKLLKNVRKGQRRLGAKETHLHFDDKRKRKDIVVQTASRHSTRYNLGSMASNVTHSTGEKNLQFENASVTDRAGSAGFDPTLASDQELINNMRLLDFLPNEKDAENVMTHSENSQIKYAQVLETDESQRVKNDLDSSTPKVNLDINNLCHQSTEFNRDATTTTEGGDDGSVQIGLQTNERRKETTNIVTEDVVSKNSLTKSAIAVNTRSTNVAETDLLKSDGDHSTNQNSNNKSTELGKLPASEQNSMGYPQKIPIAMQNASNISPWKENQQSTTLDGAPSLPQQKLNTRKQSNDAKNQQQVQQFDNQKLKRKGLLMETESHPKHDKVPKKKALSKKQKRAIKRKAARDEKLRQRRLEAAEAAKAAAFKKAKAAEAKQAAAKAQAAKRRLARLHAAIKWNDGWEDDDFKVSKSLMRLKGVRPPSSDEEEDIIFQGSHESKFKNSSTEINHHQHPRHWKPGIPTHGDLTGRRLNPPGFSRNDYQVRNSKISEVFKRYKRPNLVNSLQVTRANAKNSLSSQETESSVGIQHDFRHNTTKPRAQMPQHFGSGKTKPLIVKLAERNRNAVVKENASFVAGVMRELVDRGYNRTTKLPPFMVDEGKIAGIVAGSLKQRLRNQRLIAPTRIYKTKEKLLPLILQLT